jgi:hypothetical protein
MRSATELRGLREIRTIQSLKRSSIPRSQSSSYLDLYVMKREKDRLEKGIFTLEKKRRAIHKRLDEIKKEMDRLQQTETKRRRMVSQELTKPSEKEWKRMRLRY